MYAKNGKEIKFSIEDPIAYSDYYADSQLISGELKAVGIDATVDGVQATQWYTDSANGTSARSSTGAMEGPTRTPSTQLAGLHDIGADRQERAMATTAASTTAPPRRLEEAGRRRTQQHGGRQGATLALANDRGDTVAGRAVAIWATWCELLDCQLHGIPDAGQPVHGPGTR